MPYSCLDTVVFGYVVVRIDVIRTFVFSSPDIAEAAVGNAAHLELPPCAFFFLSGGGDVRGVGPVHILWVVDSIGMYISFVFVAGPFTLPMVRALIEETGTVSFFFFSFYATGSTKTP